MVIADKATELLPKPLPRNETSEPPPDPNSPEAKQKRADELQRRLNALRQGHGMANTPVSTEGKPDTSQITSWQQELNELGEQGVKSTEPPYRPRASYSFPTLDELNRTAKFPLIPRSPQPPDKRPTTPTMARVLKRQK